MTAFTSAGRPAPIVTFCVLTFGHHADLACRTIESIRRYCPRSRYRLIVGANAVGKPTRDYLEALRLTGAIDQLTASTENLNKCPMMRRMLGHVETEFVWWFDDDSYITGPEAWVQWLGAALEAPPATVMWGYQNRCQAAAEFTDIEDPTAFVRRAGWYRGLPPPSWRSGGKGEFNFQSRESGDGRWDFIVGGCWLIRTAALQALDWPDPRLVKLGDDVFLGEAIRQHGWALANIGTPGVAINTRTRRGDPGSSLPHHP